MITVFVVLASALGLAMPFGTRAQTGSPPAGFDRFPAEQDMEIAHQATVEAERHLTLPRNGPGGRDLNRRDPDSGLFDLRLEPPSSRFRRLEQPDGFFTIEHPDNWRTYAFESGYAVAMGPEGGVVDTGSGPQVMLYGVIVNHYTPFSGAARGPEAGRPPFGAPAADTEPWRGSLEEATEDLVRQIVRSNSYLKAQGGPARSEQIDGAPSFSAALFGRSPLTGQEERVTVVTRSLTDGSVIYVLCIVPGPEYDSMTRTFAQMLLTLDINDDPFHRGPRTGSMSTLSR